MAEKINKFYNDLADVEFSDLASSSSDEDPDNFLSDDSDSDEDKASEET